MADILGDGHGSKDSEYCSLYGSFCFQTQIPIFFSIHKYKCGGKKNWHLGQKVKITIQTAIGMISIALYSKNAWAAWICKYYNYRLHLQCKYIQV